MKDAHFDRWNERKKKLNAFKRCPHFFAGEIWWAHLGQNIGTEVFGKGDEFLRPVLILKRVYGNSCLAIPLSSIKRKGSYYFSFYDSNGTYQCALLPQIRYIDGRRLKLRLSSIAWIDLSRISSKLSFFVTINPTD